MLTETLMLAVAVGLIMVAWMGQSLNRLLPPGGLPLRSRRRPESQKLDCCFAGFLLNYNPGMGNVIEFPPDPVIEAYKKDVDRTLIRRNLALTAEERLVQLTRLQEFAEELRRAGVTARKTRD